MRDVFILCNRLDELGGVQRWSQRMEVFLTERGHNVRRIGVTGADGLHAHTPPRRGRRFVQARGAARLREILRTGRPGGVVVVAQVWAMEWVTDTFGMPVIGMSHESYRATRGSSRYQRVKRHYADADRLLLLTAEDADAWARDGMSNAAAMPNPLHVTPGRLAPLTEPVVVTLGRLSYEKGMDMLLESWSAVEDSSWRLRMYGSGPEEPALRSLAGESVEFAGVTLDIESALTEASIYALPSRSEGFPMGVVEAMAYGLPVVAFDCAPGVRELITHEVDGLLVPPGNTVEFAAALNRLIADPGLRARLGSAARDSVRRFAADTVLDRWEDLFALLYR